MIKIIYLVIAVLIYCNTSLAKSINDGAPTDNAYHWGNQQDEAKGNWMFLNNAIDQKDYKSALTPLQWLLNNSHELNVALYIQGAKVLEANVKAEQNPARKQSLQDSTLWLYNERIRLYGEEAKVINRKGRIAWKYLHKREGTEDELFVLYQNIYAQNGKSMLLQNATYYFRTAISVYRKGKIEKSEVLGFYGQMMSFLETKAVQQPEKTSSINKTNTRINKEFDKYVILNCEETQTYYETKYLENPNLSDAKKINSLLVKKSCSSNALFMSTNEFILANEPTANRYTVTAKIHLRQGDYTKSYSYFSKAIDLETDHVTQAKLYMELAKIDQKNNDFNQARANALLAIHTNQGDKKPYEFIGDLYFMSTERCSSADFLRKKSIYIATYNMYQKAGNTSKMNLAKQQFPTIEEIFVRNRKEGEQINTACWINETVSLTKR